MKTEDPKYLRSIARMKKTHYVDENGKSLCGLYWPEKRVSTSEFWFSAFHKCEKCKSRLYRREKFF